MGMYLVPWKAATSGRGFWGKWEGFHSPLSATTGRGFSHPCESNSLWPDDLPNPDKDAL